MIGFALLSLPIFAVVALGWVAMWLRLLGPGAPDALGAFAFRFALPALGFRLIAGQRLDHSFNPAFFAGYLIAGSLIFALVFGLSVIRDRQAVAGARATTAAAGNLGFLGPPLMLAFFGERGAGPLAMAILVEVIILLSVGSILMGISRNNRASVGSLVLRGTVLNPVVAAIAAGTVFASIGGVLPAPLDVFLGLLAGSAGPVALFALGGALALQRFDRGTTLAAFAVSAAKLVAYPALVWCVLTHLPQIEPFWVQTGVLLAALPSAGNIYVIARHYDADADGVSAAIALSTLLSVVTVPLAAWLVFG